MSNQSHRRHQFSRTCEPGQSHDRTCDTMRMIRSSITGAYNFLGCTSSKLATQCGGQLMLMQFCTDAALTRPLSSMCSCSYISRRRYDILYVSYGGQCLRGMVSRCYAAILAAHFASAGVIVLLTRIVIITYKCKCFLMLNS